jgi:lysophospholipase
MFSATRDKVVANGAIAALARRMPTAHLITLDGARHEILMEREAVREAFFAAFDVFIPGTPAFGEAAVEAL